MKTQELVLDGNALAGLLGEVLQVEATTIMVSCGACGAEQAVADEAVYVQCPGVIVRCRGCTEVLMRFARVRGRLVADLHGVRRLSL